MVTYKAAGRAASPSDSIWGDVPVLDWMKNPGKGIHIFDDFIGAFTALSAAGNVTTNFAITGTNPYAAMVTDTELGVLAVGTDASTQYDFTNLISNAVCEDVLKKNSGRRLWFETRFRLPDHDEDLSIAVGLGEYALVSSDVVADGVTPTTLSDYNFIGFVGFTGGTSLGDIDACYHQDGDGGTPTAVCEAIDDDDLADDEWHKLGFKFDGESTVTFYVDGVALGTTLDIDDLTGDEFDEPSHIVVSLKIAATNDDPIELDWIRFACDKYSHGYGA